MRYVLALLLPPLVLPVCASGQEAAVVRMSGGVAFEVPAGWAWRALQPMRIELFQRGVDNPLTVDVSVDVEEPWNRTWARVQREERWRLEQGGEAGYRTGEPWERHGAFRGTATVGQRRVFVTATRGAPFAHAEQAFRHVAKTLREVPKATDSVFNARTRFAMAALGDDHTWVRGAYTGGDDLRYYCYTSVCKPGRLALFAYRGPAFASVDEALADITGHFAKTGVKIGAVRKLQFPQGEAAWTEQPGTRHPLLGAVRRDGSYFFVRVGEDEAGTNLERLKPAFMSILQSIRPHDPLK